MGFWAIYLIEKFLSLNCVLNPFILKLPQLLSHFLYQNKTLALPGIGVFTLASNFSVPDAEYDGQPQTIQGIAYKQEHIDRPDPVLIDFLHKYTGKMRPLAEADLESYLQLGIQLLNIGKPFQFEGIGAIIKSKEDKYEFVPGEYSRSRLTLPGEEKAEQLNDKKKKTIDEQPEREYDPQSKVAKGVLLALGILGGIAIIAWAGYSLYKSKAPKAATIETEVVAKDDTSVSRRPDSVTLVQQQDLRAKKRDFSSMVKHGDTMLYKFVILSTANKNRALKRYNQLRSFDLKVNMDAKDSSYFKVYFPIYTLPKDTLRIKDSLSDYYATKTIIEQ